ncbi:Uncharacterised protein [Mycobacteroides abscessus subsp. abscessus]|uniref:hypothetical protein n=1 Tax=Mycobacteroides abscessus TaxID=36809 RepID=UPI0005E0EAF0|nr:hypothetical protein [Mycobacteroides abscessus]ANO17367.1 hypothetical protein BAB78_01180 [Mycobacteroides abscessus]MDB2220992.1 hypothetical protein [Mycobacteroides abscessus subsp. abscessus]OTR08816.1 hypothetical protein B9M85_01125 [Mycobacteroides abscessus]CPR89903.1 Uncharacterised protein [Mycobacteroides abscessus]SHS87534.1 Uncharacterised protein [Mycobacteroides abscessus subsp. abscessus]
MAIKPDDVDPKVKVTPEPPPLDVEYEDIDPNKPKPDTDSKAGDTNAKTGDTKPDTDAKTGDAKTGDADSKAKPDAKPKPADLRTAGKELAGAYGNTFKHPVSGIPGLIRAEYRFGEKAGDDIAKKLGDKGTKAALGKVAKYGARALPGVGVLYGGYAAVKEFKSGDYVGGVLGLVSMVPGPIGWVGIGLGLAWDTWGFGPEGVGQWDKPDGENTYMLQATAKEVAGVSNSDAALRTAQANVFSFLDGPNGTVWDSNPPAALRLDTPDVAAAATEYLTGISEHFAEIDRVMQQAGEQYISEQRQALAPHFAAMAKLKTQVKEITDQLAAISKGAETSYDAVKEANKQARSQLAGGGTLSDHGPAQTMITKLEQGQAAVIAAEDKLTKLFDTTPPPVVAVRSGTPTGTTPEKKVTETPAKPVAATPAAVTPAAQTPAKAETPTKSSDDISKLLSQLGQQKATTPTTPTSNPLGSGSGLGGGSPLGSGTGQGTGGGTPLSQSKPDTSEKKEEGKKLGDDRKLGERKTDDKDKKLDDKSLSGAKPEQAKAAVPNQEQKPGVVAPAATVPAPGAAAPTPAQQNAEHAAKAQEPSKEVDVKGQKTTFPDAKTAKLAQLLSQADPTHPMSLADAAAQAGLTPPVPGQDPGKQLSPAEAKPGDIMVADGKNFMLLGEGKFYDLTEYKIVGAAELPQTMGDRAGYFHLNDPAPNQAPAQSGEAAPAAPTTPAQPQGPVSGQTGGVQHQVPGATGAPTGPTDGSQGGQQPAAGTGGVPSTGTPGVPKPAAPGAGPANAESTNTGTGTSVPSSTPGALDPGAIK